MSDNNNNKRKDFDNKNLPDSKKRKLSHTDDKYKEEILDRVHTLNTIYITLLDSIWNIKKYNYYENIYRNEEYDLITLLRKNNYSERYIDKYLNHRFKKLPLDYIDNTEDMQLFLNRGKKFIYEVTDNSTDEDSDQETETDEDEDDKGYNPYQEAAKGLINEIFGVPLNKNNNSNQKDDSMTILIKKNNSLNKKEKEKLLNENKKINEIMNNRIPDRLKILQLNIPIEIKVELFEKLNRLENDIHEDHKTREWVNQVLKIPFGKYSSLPIKNTNDSNEISGFLKTFHNCLDNAIYGQKKVKESLIEIITKWITNKNDGKGKCIAIQGPAGVGKTSLIREGLSKALNRSFCSFSLAGVSDENYLTGFPFTYEGSTCGRFARMLIESKCMNPIIFMDELDKVDTKRSMSVYNKLIEVTDFSQNHEIEDHYFGSNIKLDMSQCIFVFSLNHLDLIDPILKDRLEVIQLGGFDVKDKIVIAKNYLIPKELVNYNDKYEFDDKIVKYIIKKIDKEQGVRNLQRAIEQIMRKLNVLKYYNKTSYSGKHKLKITEKLVNILLKDDKPIDEIILRMYN
jgi:ATP-dependent Lon protease